MAQIDLPTPGRRIRPKSSPHLLYNPTQLDLNVSSLGLDPNQCGGHYKICTKTDFHTGESTDYNIHIVGPDEVLLVGAHLVNDVRAIAPPLVDAGMLTTICKRSGFGWLLLPLTSLEQHLFISPATKPSDFTVELMRELRQAGYFKGA